MTDITRKLELLANIKSPCESYGYDVIASTCAEALAEIKRLRGQVISVDAAIGPGLMALMKAITDQSKEVGSSANIPVGEPPVWPIDWKHAVRSATVDCDTLRVDPSFKLSGKLSGNTATQVIIDDPQKPAPEPWGSAFAMNTENWK